MSSLLFTLLFADDTTTLKAHPDHDELVRIVIIEF
jgi:hypothetical protein